MTGLVLATALGLGPVASAQTIDSATDQRIRALEARIAEHERREGMNDAQPAAAPSPVTAPVPATPPAAVLPAAESSPAPVAAASADWTVLRRGMTQRQVSAALGKPDDKQVRPMSETWSYDGDRSVQFDRNGQLESWIQP